ncbi:MAG: carboxypeptidase-like regulatory domain-containing protein [Spirochaetales bacterium]|nr:carboxypeptidase-like regulatory domain-containing protein [Spirochaetales bacterium]
MLRQSRFLFIILFFCLGFSGWSGDISGEVRMYVFSDEGLPIEGAIAETGNMIYSSNKGGYIGFFHEPGVIDIKMIYKESGITDLTVEVRENQITEIIVTISKKDKGGYVVNIGYSESVTVDKIAALDDDIDSPDGETGVTDMGFLSGKVSHIETGKPVVGATIIFRGLGSEFKTDASGSFIAELPSGTYALSVIHADFSTQTIVAINIRPNEGTEVIVELTPSAMELDEVPVFATVEVQSQGGIASLLEETKNSAVLLNLIGVEQISKMGDSDAASALSRVTGLTILDGRFVYVRGMGERYSSSYLNGGYLPSPEIDKRVVPLDLFPMVIIESIAVQKAYSPDLLGDFSGGAVMVRTNGIPDDRYRRRLRSTIKMSLGFDPEKTFIEAMSEVPGGLDWLGIDDGKRKLPYEVAEKDKVILGSEVSGGLGPEEIEALGEIMPKTWMAEKRLLLPDYGIAATLSDKIEISRESNLGYNMAFIYKNSSDLQTERSEKQIIYNENTGEYFINYDYTADTTTLETDICGMIDVIVDINNILGIELSTLLVRLTDATTEQYEGYYSDDDEYIRVTDQSWIEQTLFYQRLAGSCTFSSLNESMIAWQYNYSCASRYEPDHRTTRYDSQDGDVYRLSDRPEGSRRVYVNVVDHIHDGSLSWLLPVSIFSKSPSDFIEFGAQGLYRSRTNDSRKLIFAFSEANVPGDVLEQDVDEIFTDEYIGEYFNLQETTLTTDNYTSYGIIFAGYISLDMLLFKHLRCNVGSRFEYGEQVVDTFNLYTNNPQRVVLRTFDILPSINLTLPFLSVYQARLCASKTLNRPDFHEMSNAIKDLYAGEGQIIGNTELGKADIYNVDFAVEAYPSEKESLSLGVFYKYFVNPIEEVALVKAGSTRLYSWINTPSAYNIGVEFEWKLTFAAVADLIRMSLDAHHYESFEEERKTRVFWGSVGGFFRDLYTAGNVSFIASEVSYPGNYFTDPENEIRNTSQKRPLQGQSPYVINVSLGYENSVSWSKFRPIKTSIYLNYNVFGRRILSIGTWGTPDLYEEPFHRLDVVAKQQCNEVVSVELKMKNLLDLPAYEVVGDRVQKEYRKGRRFELSVTISM